MATAAFEAERGTNKGLKLRIRPWTQNPILRLRREREVPVPAVDTYSRHMERAQLLHKRLKLRDPDRDTWTCTSMSRKQQRAANNGHFPRSQTFLGTGRTTLEFPPVDAHGLVENGRETSKIGDKSTQLGDESEHCADVTTNFGDYTTNLDYADVQNGDESFDDSLHREISITSEAPSSEIHTCLIPHTHRPQTLSTPLPNSAASGVIYSQTNGKSNHVEHKQLWAFPRSHTDLSVKTSWKRHAQSKTDQYAVKSSLDHFSPTSPSNRGRSRPKWIKDVDESSTSGVGSSASSNGEDEVGQDPSPTQTGSRPKKRRKVNIVQLCEHLKTHGLGEPLMSTSSHVPSTTCLPPGVKARCLPRDPSTREKIKGRARLEYELANLRAVAFCEQQHPRVFRTASANLKNRDVRLLEEEEREQIHRDLLDNVAEGPLDGQDDDASSLVGSPLSREELFSRIEAWEEEVQRALHHHHVHHRVHDETNPALSHSEQG